jgi:hypothetical protein
MCRTVVVVQDNRLQFRAPLDLRDWLEQRAVHAGRDESNDQRAKTELDLWREVLGLELQRTGWTLEELSCLTDILANTRPSTRPGWTGQAYNELEAARTTDAAAMNARYGADFLGQLAGKLRQLCVAGDIALVDAIRRWYGDEDLGRDRDGYTAVGFRIAVAPAAAAAAPRRRS